MTATKAGGKVIAIDPGKAGGLACLSRGGTKYTLHEVRDMPDLDTLEGLQELVGFIRKWKATTVIVETQRWRSGNSAKATWSHARHYGKVEACVALAGAFRVPVEPQVWMRKVQMQVGVCAVVGLKDTKARTWALAGLLFPTVSLLGPRGGKKDGLADAICLAWYYLQGL